MSAETLFGNLVGDCNLWMYGDIHGENHTV